MESLGGFLRDVLPFKFRGISTSVAGKAKDVLLDKKRRAFLRDSIGL